MIYLDSYNVIFAKDTIANKEIILKYTITQEKVKINSADLSDKEKVGRLSDFFRNVGWYDAMMKMDLRYLDFDPSNCVSLRHVAAVMQQTKNVMADAYMNRYLATCIQK